LLSSSLIVNADVSASAAIVDTKLATISTAGKVANSATTATALNTPNTIVLRDGSGNFAAGTITASLTGAASLNVLKAGDTMTGTLTMPAGSAAVPSIQFTGSANTGFSAATVNTLSFDTNGAERMNINPTGGVTINAFGTAGVVHNNASGLLSSSLIVDADITNATISNAKLATISSADTAGNIVVRDGSGNFATNMITINGTVTNPTDVATKAYVDASSSAVTGANIGAGTGLIFRDKTGSTLNFKSLIQGSHIVITNNANDITLATDATSANTASTIVARDASGNFSAGEVSMTDAVIDNLTITNCIASACVTALSVADQSLTGTLSVNDEVLNGTLQLTALTPAGVVHNNASGLLSSSLIVNADITNATISNAKLATISSTDTAGNIVVRDGSGNFATNMITINGTVTNPTDVATKAYVDSVGSAITGANVGAGTGLIFRDKTGSTLNFKSLVQGSHITITNNTNDITLATDGTNLNTVSTLVARDAAGNFSASIVSVTDSVASGNLVLSANPSTSTTGNIMKGANRFIHNFGTSSTFVGENAGNFTMSGTGLNVAVGASALSANTTGNNNTAVGYNTLPAVTTGSSNIAIGSSSGGTLTTGSGNIYINANAAAAAENTTIRIGTSQTTCFVAGIDGVGVSGNGVVVDANGQLGITLSSERFKHNIADMASLSEHILNLRPVTFAYNNDPSEAIQYGLIAEEVDQVFPALVAKDEDGNPYTVRYHLLPVLLLNELQKQQATIETMKQQYATVEEMNNAISNLQTQINNLMQYSDNVQVSA
jgi:gas vesicle protein